MNWIYIAVLFFILTPNVLIRIPQKGSIMLVAAVHAVLFAVIYHFTNKWVVRQTYSTVIDTFKEGKSSRSSSSKKTNKTNKSKNSGNGNGIASNQMRNAAASAAVNQATKQKRK